MSPAAARADSAATVTPADHRARSLELFFDRHYLAARRTPNCAGQ